MTFSDRTDLSCATCPADVKALRRCAEPRLDFHHTKGDPQFFPMKAMDGGSLFGFCPGKATWYPALAALYRALVVCAETGAMPHSGGLMDQPDWMIELLGWFIPRYKAVQFQSRCAQVLGKAKPEVPKGGDK